jgi:hypothetical protein
LFVLPQVTHLLLVFTVTAFSTGLLSAVSPAKRKIRTCESVSALKFVTTLNCCSTFDPGTVIPASFAGTDLGIACAV